MGKTYGLWKCVMPGDLTANEVVEIAAGDTPAVKAEG